MATSHGDVLTLPGIDPNSNITVKRLNERAVELNIDYDAGWIMLDQVSVGQLWRFLQTLHGTMQS